MRVFVTGPVGFIGTSLTRRLLEQRHEVVGLVRSQERADVLRRNGGRPVVGDLRVPAGWSAAAEEADALIHTAAVAFKRRGGMKWIRELRAADLAATRALADIARRGKKRLLYTSGFLAVGDHGDQWVDEATTPTPGVRGDAYLQGERIVAEAVRDGVAGASLRLGFVYGLNGSSGFFERMMLRDAAKGSFMHIGSGKNFVPTIALDDAVDAYVRALTAPLDGSAINVVDDDPLRMGELGAVLLAEFGRGKPKAVPLFLGRLMAGGPVAEAFSGSCRTKNAKAKHLLGWSLRHSSFREGIRLVVAEYRRLTGSDRA